MAAVKDVTLNNSSGQALTFKLTWPGGGVEQRVFDHGMARADMRGIKDKSEVTVDTKYGNSPISVKFNYSETGGHGELIINADGSHTWNNR